MSARSALNPDFSRMQNHEIRRNHNSPAARWTSMAAAKKMMMMDNSYSARKGKEECRLLGKSAAKKLPCIINMMNRGRLPNYITPLNIKFGGDTSEDDDMLPFEAEHNEEFWAAARLRAECHWENRENERNAETRKWLYAQREFTSLKKRCDGQVVKQCKCFLMLKKEDGSGYENRIVATLDLNVQFVSLRDQSFLPDHKKRDERRLISRPGDKYGYISNLCVAKTARRQGIATTMLHHAISSARDLGLERVFIRVNEDNEAAITLYEKIGFKVVIDANYSESSSTELISSSSARAQPLVMCFDVAKNLLQ